MLHFPWFFIPCLKVCTAISTNSFDDGWYGALVIWHIPFLQVKILKPLLDTITSGSPCVPKVALSFSIVVSVVTELRQWMSNYFECASTIRRNIFPMKGPAKSMCIRVHGCFGHSQGCMVARAGIFWCAWHNWQLFTFSSNAELILGHQT